MYRQSHYEIACEAHKRMDAICSSRGSMREEELRCGGCPSRAGGRSRSSRSTRLFRWSGYYGHIA